MRRTDRALRLVALAACLVFPLWASAQDAGPPGMPPHDGNHPGGPGGPGHPPHAPTSIGAPGMSARPGVQGVATPVALPVVKPSAATLAAANELMSLQEDTVVLKAQLKKLDAQAQVAERQASLGRMGQSISYDDITVVATQSLGGHRMATIDIDNGNELDVQAGDTLPNGMHVLAIRSGAVVVDRNGHRQTLAVSSPHSQVSRYASAGALSSGAGSMSSLPSLPSR